MSYNITSILNVSDITAAGDRLFPTETRAVDLEGGAVNELL